MPAGVFGQPEMANKTISLNEVNGIQQLQFDIRIGFLSQNPIHCSGGSLSSWTILSSLPSSLSPSPHIPPSSLPLSAPPSSLSTSLLSPSPCFSLSSFLLSLLPLLFSLLLVPPPFSPSPFHSSSDRVAWGHGGSPSAWGQFRCVSLPSPGRTCQQFWTATPPVPLEGQPLPPQCWSSPEKRLSVTPSSLLTPLFPWPSSPLVPPVLGCSCCPLQLARWASVWMVKSPCHARHITSNLYSQITRFHFCGS